MSVITKMAFDIKWCEIKVQLQLATVDKDGQPLTAKTHSEAVLCEFLMFVSTEGGLKSAF